MPLQNFYLVKFRDIYLVNLVKTNIFRFRRDARFRQFQKFKDYIRNYWASKDFTELSVFGLDKRTNNDVESNHYQFNTLVEVKHQLGSAPLSSELDSAQPGLIWLSTALGSILALKFKRSPFCSNTFEFSMFISYNTTIL